MYFKYGKKEISYLKSKDKKLADVIEKTGLIKREVEPDLFCAVVHNISGQQISNKALTTIWQRLQNACGQITPEAIFEVDIQALRSCGLSARKVEYIKDFAAQIINGTIDIDAIQKLPDEEVVKLLSGLKGIGVWTAEMILLFCLQRKNVLSYGDLGIQRGLKMLYHHRKITKTLFEKYRKRFSPYGSVASFYLWAVAGGAVSDSLPKK